MEIVLLIISVLNCLCFYAALQLFRQIEKVRIVEEGKDVDNDYIIKCVFLILMFLIAGLFLTFFSIIYYHTNYSDTIYIDTIPLLSYCIAISFSVVWAFFSILETCLIIKYVPYLLQRKKDSKQKDRLYTQFGCPSQSFYYKKDLHLLSNSVLLFKKERKISLFGRLLDYKDITKCTLSNKPLSYEVGAIHHVLNEIVYETIIGDCVSVIYNYVSNIYTSFVNWMNLNKNEKQDLVERNIVTIYANDPSRSKFIIKLRNNTSDAFLLQHMIVSVIKIDERRSYKKVKKDS